MKDFLQQDICVEDARIVVDEPFTPEEYAALAQLLDKFRNQKCGSISDLMNVSMTLVMVKDSATREVKNNV
jgi:hypothetical protein